MATLNENKLNKKRKEKKIVILIATVIELTMTPWIASIVDQILISKSFHSLNLNYGMAILECFHSKNVQILFVVLQIAWLILILSLTLDVAPVIARVDEIRITDNISIPVPAGNGQHGKERFMTEEEKKKVYSYFEFNGANSPPDKGGIVVDYKKIGNKDGILYIAEDKHSLIIGASGAGKDRRVLLATLCMQILSGLSVIASDVKGELYYYTSKFAESMEYTTLAVDFRNPEKSVNYNFMQPILNAIKDGDQAQAIDYTWDLVSVLVGQQKGEPLWYNGETATIAAAILVVALDAPEEFRNLTNVYYFLAFMCRSNVYGEMPITDYLEKLPDTHPAKGVFAMAEIAAEKTRSSFFTSALGTLKLFTNPKIAAMTSSSDFDLRDIGNKKTIVYMIVPDEKKTMYPLISILITQMYTALVECANENGLRLPCNTDFDLDEAGNFPFIPVLGNILSAGRSRGVRANLVIQDYQQLESKYKDDFKNIKTNCQVKIYLKTDDPDTLKQLSEGLGKYTVEVSSASSSAQDGKKNNMNFSSSASLTGRSLLEPAELKRFKAPAALINYTGEYSAITNLPDLSQYKFNKLLGLGDEEFNTRLMIEREAERESHDVPEIHLWGIWNQDSSDGIPEENEKPQRVSFL